VTLTQQHPENSGILPTINSNESNNLCLGQTITLTATAGTDFLWSNGATTQSIVVSEPGSYECTVTNFCGSNTSLPFVVSSAVPSPPVVEDVSACTGTYVVLEASSTGEVEWFDDNGNFLNNGITHTTNPLIENMTIWVQNTDSYTETVNAEPYTNGIGGGGYLSSNHGSIFHAYTPFTLKSVLLYALNGGSVTIELQEEDGTVIQVFTETVPAGASRINLNFEIPTGYNYQLVGTNLPNGGLYRNNNSATYPYILDDILSIVGATSSSSYFYYFYDWEIETENGTCTSDLIPVQVTVADPDTPIAEGTTICTNEVAQLTASGSGTLNWLDALGTILGTGPNFSTPTLTETTTFYVQASENNCTSISVPVEVLVESCADLSALTIKNTIGISPNPSNGIFLISYDLAQKNKVEIEIISTTGKRIFKKSYQDQAGENNHEISLKNVSDGIYSIIISSGQEIYTDRLVIQND